MAKSNNRSSLILKLSESDGRRGTTTATITTDSVEGVLGALNSWNLLQPDGDSDGGGGGADIVIQS